MGSQGLECEVSDLFPLHICCTDLSACPLLSGKLLPQPFEKNIGSMKEPGLDLGKFVVENELCF